MIKEFELPSYVKGFHVHKALWTPKVGETIQCEGEPDNPIDKYAVCIKKENKIVDIYPSESLVNLLKQYSISSELTN